MPKFYDFTCHCPVFGEHGCRQMALARCSIPIRNSKSAKLGSMDGTSAKTVSLAHATAAKASMSTIAKTTDTGLTTEKGFPIMIVLQGLSQVGDLEDNGRNWFSSGMQDYVFIVPKARGLEEAAVLAQDPRRKFNEDVVWRLIQYSIFEILNKQGEKACSAFLDVSRVFITGLSIGGEGALNVASLPGVGRTLAGVVPTACRGHDHCVFTAAALREFRDLPVWGVQNATDHREYKMDAMFDFLGLADSEKDESLSPTKKVKIVETKTIEYPWDEEFMENQMTRVSCYTYYQSEITKKKYYREIRKKKHGGQNSNQSLAFLSKELWTIADSRSTQWVGWTESVKHHDSWTVTWKTGVAGRNLHSWCAQQKSNLRTAVLEEISYTVLIGSAIKKPLSAVNTEGDASIFSAPGNASVSQDCCNFPHCPAKCLGLWLSPEGELGTNTYWKYGAQCEHEAFNQCLDKNAPVVPFMVGDTVETVTAMATADKQKFMIKMKREQHIGARNITSQSEQNGALESSAFSSVRRDDVDPSPELIASKMGLAKDDYKDDEYFQWWMRREESRRSLMRDYYTFGFFDVGIEYGTALPKEGYSSLVGSGNRSGGSKSKRAQMGWALPLPPQQKKQFLRCRRFLQTMCKKALVTLIEEEIKAAEEDFRMPASTVKGFREEVSRAVSWEMQLGKPEAMVDKNAMTDGNFEDAANALPDLVFAQTMFEESGHPRLWTPKPDLFVELMLKLTRKMDEHEKHIGDANNRKQQRRWVWQLVEFLEQICEVKVVEHRTEIELQLPSGEKTIQVKRAWIPVATSGSNNELGATVSSVNSQLGLDKELHFPVSRNRIKDWDIENGVMGNGFFEVFIDSRQRSRIWKKDGQMKIRFKNVVLIPDPDQSEDAEVTDSTNVAMLKSQSAVFSIVANIESANAAAGLADATNAAMSINPELQKAAVEKAQRSALHNLHPASPGHPNYSVAAARRRILSTILGFFGSEPENSSLGQSPKRPQAEDLEDGSQEHAALRRSNLYNAARELFDMTMKGQLERERTGVWRCYP